VVPEKVPGYWRRARDGGKRGWRKRGWRKRWWWWQNAMQLFTQLFKVLVGPGREISWEP